MNKRKKGKRGACFVSEENDIGMTGRVAKKGKQAGEEEADDSDGADGADIGDGGNHSGELELGGMDEDMEADGFTTVVNRRMRKHQKQMSENNSSDGESTEKTPTCDRDEGSLSQQSKPGKEIIKLFFPTGTDKTYEEMVEWALTLQDEFSLNELRIHIGNRVPYFTTTCQNIANKLTSEELNGIKLHRPESGEKHTKILIKDYPPVMPVDWVERHPQIKWAKRRMKGEQKQWQVIACWKGELPSEKIRFAPIIAPCMVVRYIESPKICAKCQQWGHFKAQCKGRWMCGVCGGRHESKLCVDKLATGGAEKPTVKCPGCKGPHKAWSWACPKRPTWEGAIVKKISEIPQVIENEQLPQTEQEKLRR